MVPKIETKKNPIQTKDEALVELFQRAVEWLKDDFQLMLEKAYWTGYGQGCKDTKEGGETKRCPTK